MKKDKRIFSYIELVFDLFYLYTALILGFYTLLKGTVLPQKLAGIMGILLVFGDSFHLIPRVAAILSSNKPKYRNALGIGKLITSITMTAFYMLLWIIGMLIFSPPYSTIFTGIVFALAVVRVVLCLSPKNKWTDANPPVNWGIIRNVPFVLQGFIVVILFWLYRNLRPELSAMWLAILLSFLFYIPVVLFSHKYPKIGMLMLPKTIMYIWLLVICLRI